MTIRYPLAWAALAAALLALAYEKREVILSAIGPRGIRNNNPGNIRRSATIWQGQAPADQQTDPAFIIFLSPEYGIRAMAKVLATYRNTYGLRTVADIINRWAPPGENNTAAYIAAVAGALGVDPFDELQADQQPALIKAIIRHENGVQPYSDETIQKGLALA